MRHYPADESDWKEAKRVGALEWQLNALSMNPDYTAWGVYEDYMCEKGTGWRSPIITERWQDDKPELDDLNEVVNFYFEIARSSIECPVCGGECYNPATAELSRTFYDFDGTGKRWCNAITQDEVDYLISKGRLWDFKDHPVAADVNASDHPHDAINRWMLIQYRAEKLGVFGYCEHCNGSGEEFTEPEPHLALTLWLLHPRKGASRGWRYERLEQSDLVEAIQMLQKAAQRNAYRFSRLKLPETI